MLYVNFILDTKKMHLQLMRSDKNVGSAFGDALGGVLSVVAQNAVVTMNDFM
jgi:hypothetical protein